MEPLDRTLRKTLEDTVKDAREVAETAARAALEQMGVGEASLYSHLSKEEQDLRRKLRAHGRQLGDVRNPKTEKQEIDRLVEEVAYEHWHRMLFARFLAENNLLMYPDPDEPVPVTLEDCEDLAADEGAANGWELAAQYAARMLPQIFRTTSPVFQLVLPPEYQQRLEQLIASLHPEVFSASDSLGWVYQFWQAKKKKAVNDSEVKIGARELPAVTQLFTEPYMVAFLLDNSLGAWWASRQLSETDLKTAQSEEELRNLAALPGVPLEYLRFVKDESGTRMPAGGTYSHWPETLSEFKVLDPCCGSGHFLVAAFLMLVPMRIALEDLTAKEAVDAVLRDNLNGLEIDQRCVELAAFALALTAWRYPDAGGYRTLPELNIACSGLSLSLAKEDWRKLALNKGNLRIALDWIYEVFQDAPILGSLINPKKTSAANIVGWNELKEHLSEALSREDLEEKEAGVVAKGLSKAAILLSDKYHWIITNVPYLTRRKQNETLKEFCRQKYDDAKSDLATAFLARCLEFCCLGGVASVVLPQNWLFLTSYKGFRETLLKNKQWKLIARLGPGAFETISGEVVKAILVNIVQQDPRPAEKMLSSMSHESVIHGIDVSEYSSSPEKANHLIRGNLHSIIQEDQLKNPDSRVVFDDLSTKTFLSKVADYGKGSTTGDGQRFLLYFWEFPFITSSHVYWLNSPDGVSPWSGRSQICKVKLDDDELNSQKGCWLRGQDIYGRKGVAVNKMKKLEPLLYMGEAFDDNICPICPKDENHIPAIWAYVTSEEYHSAVRSVDQALKVTAGTITKVPFDLEYWQEVAEEIYPNGIPKPFSSDPSQWLFHGHIMESSMALQVAVSRLLGYRWPAESDPRIHLSEKSKFLLSSLGEMDNLVDEDGIVCIPPIRGELGAADRVLNLLAAAYGSSWSNEYILSFLRDVGYVGKTLESWLREKFFAQHCELFQDRPFVWHIWDGLRDGFGALVNYHKLDGKLLETLIYTYLGDWINRQKQDLTNGVDGAGEKIAAAETLKKRLELILEGEAPYDIFVRWKPDLNDGVRLNIRPFMSVPDVGRKGAGVLRDKPNIKWNKDRGKDVTSAPWYHLGLEYGGNEGDRINDHHLTLPEKKAAREAAK